MANKELLVSKDEYVENLFYLAGSRQFLMQEFLTWLCYMAEQAGPSTVRANGADYFLDVYEMVNLVSPNGECRIKTGVPTNGKRFWSELLSGKQVNTAKFALSREDLMWEFTLGCDSLMPKAMKMPASQAGDFESHMEHRVELMREVRGFIRYMAEEYLKMRFSPDFEESVLKPFRRYANDRAR